jgi:maltooligosyltrehalose trehalohydrolase
MSVHRSRRRRWSQSGFISHSDPELVENVRKGRRQEFAHFHGDGPAPDPQAEETFGQCILSWACDISDGSLLAFYRALIAFRKERLAMKGKERYTVKVYEPQEKIIAFERSHGPDRLLILLNFGKATASFELPSAEAAKKIFDSSAAEWGGPGTVIPDYATMTSAVMLNPESAVIFQL